MLEIPEAAVLAAQVSDRVVGHTIADVAVLASPHRFAFFTGDPEDYRAVLTGRTLTSAVAWGGLVEVGVGDRSLVFGDGVNLRLHEAGAALPSKHQLLLTFSDGCSLSAGVQMYGQLSLVDPETYDNPHYLVARQRPSPLTDAFSPAFFDDLIGAPGLEKLSLKALLATEQRIPGLGNGVLQDILWHARLNPRRRLVTVDAAGRSGLYAAIRDVLARMTASGGRDTETDLCGWAGGYATVLSRLTLGRPCPRCEASVVKQPYLGGSVYFCPVCQPL